MEIAIKSLYSAESCLTLLEHDLKYGCQKREFMAAAQNAC